MITEIIIEGSIYTCISLAVLALFVAIFLQDMKTRREAVEWGGPFKGSFSPLMLLLCVIAGLFTALGVLTILEGLGILHFKH